MGLHTERLCASRIVFDSVRISALCGTGELRVGKRFFAGRPTSSQNGSSIKTSDLVSYDFHTS